MLPTITPQDPALIEAQLEGNLLDGRVTAHTHETVVSEMTTPPSPAVTATPVKTIPVKAATEHRGDLFAPATQAASVPSTTTATAAALLLGSPDFQRR